MARTFHCEYRKVSKEQFEAFIKSHRNKLEVHGVHFITPPRICYCDFEGGKEYPENIVAQIQQNSSLNDSLSKTHYEDEYFIKVEEE